MTTLSPAIIASTVWRLPHPTRIVWITMLALQDRRNVVMASVPGLADIARVSVEEAREAIRTLESPDPDSRSKIEEGRRIKPVDGGWWIVNGRRCREAMSDDVRRDRMRQYMRTRRATKLATATVSSTECNTQDTNDLPLQQTDLEKKNPPPSLPPPHTPPPTVPPQEKENVLLPEAPAPEPIPQGKTLMEVFAEEEARKKTPPITARVQELMDVAATPKPFERPTGEMMRLYGAKIGLPEREVDKCRTYYDANGWKVGKNPAKDWQAVMRHWKLRWEEQGRPSNGAARPQAAAPQQGNGGIWAMKQQIEAMEHEIKNLESRYLSHVAGGGTHWSGSQAQRSRLTVLRATVKTIRERIANSALES